MIATVLLIESDDRIAQSLIALMSNTFRVIYAKSVTEAKHAVGDDVIDVVILDLELPDSRGAKTVRRAVEFMPGIPIVVYSAVNGEEIEASLRAGAQRFISKNETSAELIKTTILLAIEQQKRTSLEKKEASMHAELMVARQKINEVLAEIRKAFRISASERR